MRCSASRTKAELHPTQGPLLRRIFLRTDNSVNELFFFFRSGVLTPLPIQRCTRPVAMVAIYLVHVPVYIYIGDACYCCKAVAVHLHTITQKSLTGKPKLYPPYSLFDAITKNILEHIFVLFVLVYVCFCGIFRSFFERVTSLHTSTFRRNAE